VVTGAVSEEFAANIIKSGADDYILKDRLNRLPAAIDTVLRLRKIEKEKQEAAEKLRLSEENYRTLVDQAFDSIIIYTPDFVILDCNRRACITLGYSREELKEQSVTELFFKEDIIARPLYFETLKAGQRTLDYRRLKKKDGSGIEMEIGTKMMPDGNLMAIARDITERKKAEQKIIESETNLRTIFENTSEGFLLLDKNAVVVAFNNKATAYTFFSNVKEFKIGQSIYDFIEESRKGFFQEIIAKVLNGESIQYDRSYVIKNGLTVWIDFSATPVIEGRQIKGICIAGRNITEKKIIEQERDFDRNNLKALINNTNDMMWSVDRDLKLITSNEAFDRMVKAMSGKIVAKGSDVLASGFSTEQLNVFRKYYERAFSGESFTEIEHADFPDDFWSEISFYPVYNGDSIIGAACFSRDITERKKAEENLKSLEKKMLEQIIQEQKKIARAIIKAEERERNHIGQELHDNINQILAGIKLHLSMTGKDEKLKELVKYPIELIDNTIQEIRLLSSKLVTPLKNINLKELIQYLIGDLRKSTAIKTTLIYNLSGVPISDELKLNIYRTIQEQLNNVVKHANAKKIVLSVQTDNNVIRIVVADDGKGFDVNKKRKGIGISNMMNRVESFNGEMAIETSPGKGCKISFKIPC
jgi:PAS domain S-box-containing protein